MILKCSTNKVVNHTAQPKFLAIPCIIHVIFHHASTVACGIVFALCLCDFNYVNCKTRQSTSQWQTFNTGCNLIAIFYNYYTDNIATVPETLTVVYIRVSLAARDN